MKKKYKKPLLKRILSDINTRCYNSNNKKYYLYGGKGITNRLSFEDLKYVWKRDKGWLLKRPSIDRENSSKSYTIENSQFIEFSENCRKPSIEHQHKVHQFTLNNKFIKEWANVKEVSKFLNIHPVSVNRICRTETTRTGFIWRYIKPTRKSKRRPKNVKSN